MTRRALLLSTALALPSACEDGETDTDADTHTNTGAATASNPSTGSGTGSQPDTSTAASSGSTSSSGSTPEATQSVRIPFAARVGDLEANCTDTYPGLGTQGDQGTFRDLRFYVSNLRLLNEDGEEVAVELDQDSPWQHENVALLDFEDGTHGCSESGNAGLNNVVSGTVPAARYSGVRFELGVPSELNHTDVNIAEPPLNVISMAWNWLVGRKFARIDLSIETGANWNTHLGSQGCSNEGAGTAEPPTRACSRPQRPRIALDNFDPETDTIVADIAALLGDNDVGQNPESSIGCMSFYTPGEDNPECAALFPNFGLDWTTGDCDRNCAGQTMFSVE